MGLDRLAYAPEPPEEAEEEPPPPHDARTYVIPGLFRGLLDEWRGDVVGAIKEVRQGAGRRVAAHLGKVAERVNNCGSMVQVRYCNACGVVVGRTVSADCEARFCPDCARQDAQELRRKLRGALKKWPNVRHGREWFMWTFPVPYDGTTSIDRLASDRERALKAWRAVWKYLKKNAAGERALVALEVGARGLVHAHVLVQHRWLSSDELHHARQVALPHLGPNARQLNVRRCRKGKGGIAEVAKYITKGSVGSGLVARPHPMLCALLEAAWMGKPRILWYGDWEGIPDEPMPEVACPACGSLDVRCRYEPATPDSDYSISNIGPPE